MKESFGIVKMQMMENERWSLTVVDGTVEVDGAVTTDEETGIFF